MERSWVHVAPARGPTPGPPPREEDHGEEHDNRAAPGFFQFLRHWRDFLLRSLPAHAQCIKDSETRGKVFAEFRLRIFRVWRWMQEHVFFENDEHRYSKVRMALTSTAVFGVLFMGFSRTSLLGLPSLRRSVSAGNGGFGSGLRSATSRWRFWLAGPLVLGLGLLASAPEESTLENATKVCLGVFYPFFQQQGHS